MYFTNEKRYVIIKKDKDLVMKIKREENTIMNEKAKKLWILFKSMFMLSACTFGGGFVIVSLMKKKYVEELKWLEEDEMLDVTAITQSAPGPLPVNASVIIGYRMAGVVGSLVAVLGTILPPMIIISIISLFYDQFRTNKYCSGTTSNEGRCGSSHIRCGNQPCKECLQNKASFIHSYDDCGIYLHLCA